MRKLPASIALTTVIVTTLVMSTQNATAVSDQMQHDGGGATLIDTPITSRIFLTLPSSPTSGEKLAAVIDSIDAVSSAIRMFSASAGGLWVGNLKK